MAIASKPARKRIRRSNGEQSVAGDATTTSHGQPKL
jgi:hypothetical protein